MKHGIARFTRETSPSRSVAWHGRGQDLTPAKNFLAGFDGGSRSCDGGTAETFLNFSASLPLLAPPPSRADAECLSAELVQKFRLRRFASGSIEHSTPRKGNSKIGPKSQ